MNRITTLLFDLDGTLIDSIPDLTTGINLLRGELGYAPIASEQVRDYVGDGVGLLVSRALPEGVYSEALRDRYMALYEAHLTDRTFIYPGILEFLDSQQGRPMAVVTNKPQRLAEQVVERLGLAPYFREVIGAEEHWRKKPEPDMVLEALRRLDRPARQAVLLGDHHVDLTAARAAGTAACFCAWGFGHDAGQPADYRARTTAELMQLFPGTGP